jgi:hypothetical protein
VSFIIKNPCDNKIIQKFEDDLEAITFVGVTKLSSYEAILNHANPVVPT